MIANFFDISFNPPLAPTLLAFVLLEQRVPRGADPREIGPAVAAAAGIVAVWFAGFMLAWTSKWVFAAAILGADPVLPNIWGKILLRTDGLVPDVPPETIGFFTPAYDALDQAGFPLIAICVGLAVAALVLRLIVSGFSTAELAGFAVRRLPLIIPVGWVGLARNHSIIHAGFVSRSFILFAVFPLLAALDAWRGTPRTAPTKA